MPPSCIFNYFWYSIYTSSWKNNHVDIKLPSYGYWSTNPHANNTEDLEYSGSTLSRYNIEPSCTPNSKRCNVTFTNIISMPYVNMNGELKLYEYDKSSLPYKPGEYTGKNLWKFKRIITVFYPSVLLADKHRIAQNAYKSELEERENQKRSEELQRQLTNIFFLAICVVGFFLSIYILRRLLSKVKSYSSAAQKISQTVVTNYTKEKPEIQIKKDIIKAVEANDLVKARELADILEKMNVKK